MEKTLNENEFCPSRDIQSVSQVTITQKFIKHFRPRLHNQTVDGWSSNAVLQFPFLDKAFAGWHPSPTMNYQDEVLLPTNVASRNCIKWLAQIMKARGSASRCCAAALTRTREELQAGCGVHACRS